MHYSFGSTKYCGHETVFDFLPFRHKSEEISRYFMLKIINVIIDKMDERIDPILLCHVIKKHIHTCL